MFLRRSLSRGGGGCLNKRGWRSLPRPALIFISLSAPPRLTGWLMRSESVFHPNACRVFAGSHKLRFALMAIVCFFIPPSGFSFKAAVLCRISPSFFCLLLERVSAVTHSFGNIPLCDVTNCAHNLLITYNPGSQQKLVIRLIKIQLYWFLQRVV